MSWYIKIVGTKSAVKSAVIADPQLPSAIKDLICSICDEETVFNGVSLDTHGHIYSGPGSAYSNVGKFEIQPINVLV